MMHIFDIYPAGNYQPDNADNCHTHQPFESPSLLNRTDKGFGISRDDQIPGFIHVGIRCIQDGFIGFLQNLPEGCIVV